MTYDRKRFITRLVKAGMEERIAYACVDGLSEALQPPRSSILRSSKAG